MKYCFTTIDPLDPPHFSSSHCEHVQFAILSWGCKMRNYDKYQLHLNSATHPLTSTYGVFVSGIESKVVHSPK